ncbi:TrfB-related DNA-binding protein [Aeromonas caviae]
MTDEEFELVTRGLGIRPQSLKMAHQVIVLGQSQADVARANEVSKSAISQLVKKIYAAQAPAGFVMIHLPIPKALEGSIRRFSELTLQRQSAMQGEGAEAEAEALLLEALRPYDAD